MKDKTKRQILELVKETNPHIDVIVISTLPAGGRFMPLEEWVSLCEQYNEFDKPYEHGSHVTFHYADNTFIHFKF